VNGVVFNEAHGERNQPERIVTLGIYLPVAAALDAHGELRYVRETGASGYSASDVADRKATLQWTRLIDALNQGRKWARERLFARLDGMVAAGVAVAVVPSHDPFVNEPPIRLLGQRLAQSHDRIDATGCLVRHTKIRRIVWGGPSYASLHRDTIRVEDAHRVAGRDVLLLDDIARSGASLRACRQMLLEAGAASVQAVALGRVVAKQRTAS